MQKSNRVAKSTTQPAKRLTKPRGAKPKAPEAQPAHDGSNSLMRMLGLFNLFTPAAPSWTSEALISALGMSRSTGYRYIKALADVGLLTPVLNGHYILGPRIIEFDLQIRQCDPLYNAAGPAMKKLAQESGLSVVVCALYSGSVLCVREELAPDSPPHIFSRGQRRPLFRGAASKIILAHLVPHQLRSLYAKHKSAVATSGLGADWDSFRSNLTEIRRVGFVTTLGEFNPGVLGISAPLFNSSGQILGSIGVAGAESKFNRAEMEHMVALVKDAARQVTERIGLVGVGTDRPARAVR